MKQTTHDDALAFYRSFLSSINVAEGENGELLHYVSNRAEPKPILIKSKEDGVNVDKPLVMPTKDNLRRLSVDGLIGFNPLCESSVRGESEVFRKLKRLVIFKINQSVLVLMQNLARLSVAEDSSKRLNSKQMEFLALALGDDLPKDKFVSKLTKSFAAAGADKSQVLPATIYIKRDAKQPGVADPFRRAAIVSFPYAVEASKKPEQLAGVTFAVYEMRIINNMLEAILPGLTLQDTYSYYGNPAVVPNFSALLHAWYSVASKLNEAMILFDGEDLDIAKIDLSWYGKMNSMSSWIGVIQPLAGNEGDGEDNTERLVRDTATNDRVRQVRDSESQVRRRPVQREYERQPTPSQSPASTGGVERVKLGGASRMREDDRDLRQPHREERRPLRTQPRDYPQYSDDGLDSGRDLSRDLARMSRESRGEDRGGQRQPHDPYGVNRRYPDRGRDDYDNYRQPPRRTNF